MTCRLKYEWKIQNCGYVIYMAGVALGLVFPFLTRNLEPRLFPTQRLRNLGWTERAVRQKRQRVGRQGVGQSGKRSSNYSEWPGTDTERALNEWCWMNE